jgi:serine/threonine protein kinase
MTDIAKVVDFGLVKETGEVGMTEAGALTGTPLYMAPEAITAPDSVDGRSDLYALGAVTYYLLSGRDVFEGKSVVEVCAQHLTKTPEPPSAHAKQAIPEALERLVLQCLEKDPAKRPQTAAAFAERLLEIDDIPAWTIHRATEWWATHGPSLRARRDGPADELGETLAVDLDARQRETD